MRNLSIAAKEALSQGTIRIFDLYKLTLQGSETVYFTNCDKDLVVEGVTYSVLPSPQAFSFEQNMELKAGEAQVQLIGISPDLHNLIMNALLDRAVVEVSKALLDYDFQYITHFAVFKGKIAGATINENQSVVISVRDLAYYLSSKVPRRLYSNNCGFQLYGPYCKVEKDVYKKSGTISEVQGTYMLKDSSCTAEDGYYGGGVIKVVTSEGFSLYRTVLKFEDRTFYVAPGIYNFEVVGCTYEVYPGCDKTYATCREKFNNGENFGGFTLIPRIEELFYV